MSERNQVDLGKWSFESKDFNGENLTDESIYSITLTNKAAGIAYKVYQNGKLFETFNGVKSKWELI
jgi:hypothetical protein